VARAVCAKPYRLLRCQAPRRGTVPPVVVIIVINHPPATADPTTPVAPAPATSAAEAVCSAVRTCRRSVGQSAP
jgi:hypothetical protein